MPSDTSLLSRFGPKKPRTDDDGEGKKEETTITFEQDEDLATQLAGDVLPGEGYTKVDIGKRDGAASPIVIQQSQDDTVTVADGDLQATGAFDVS